MKDELTKAREALLALLDPYYNSHGKGLAISALTDMGYNIRKYLMREPYYTTDRLSAMYANAKDFPPLKKIGIAISTHNRREVFNKCYAKICEYSKGCKIVVVDDASDVPCPQATYRFNKPAGIAKVKNKCFDLLSDCDYIFLFDDDAYPKLPLWFVPYVLSDCAHMMYLFSDHRYRQNPKGMRIFTLDNIQVHHHAKGCMLYYDKKKVNIPLKMNEGFGRWGGEHAELSDRIFFNGETEFPYMDLDYSFDLIYSADEYNSITRSVPDEERLVCHAFTTEFYNEITQARPVGNECGEGDLVIAHILTALPDPQRGTRWAKDKSLAQALIRSVNAKSGAKVVILNDFFDGKYHGAQFIKYPEGVNPLFYKWIITYDYLNKHRDYKNVFIVDVNDVEMLNNPFPFMKKDTLYVGTDEEGGRINKEWMIKNSGDGVVNRFVVSCNERMFNSGVVGGRLNIVLHFLRLTLFWFIKFYTNVGKRNMPLFNYILRKKWNYNIDFGKHVTTGFKKYEYTSAWWKHK
jgi:hypothetical protein